MEVVDGVEVVVFIVPGKGGEEHPKVHPGHVDALVQLVCVAQHRARHVGEVVEVPTVACRQWQPT